MFPRAKQRYLGEEGISQGFIDSQLVYKGRLWPARLDTSALSTTQISNSISAILPKTNKILHHPKPKHTLLFIMKFTTSITLFSVISGAFGLVIERDLATVKKVTADVQAGIDDLGAAAKAFNGDIQPIAEAAAKLITTIKSGTTTVAASSNLSVGDALALVDGTKNLQAHSQALVDQFKARKGDIQKAKQCEVTKATITEINTDSQALIKAIVSKVPPFAQGIAAKQSQGIINVLNDAQNSFANCQDA